MVHAQAIMIAALRGVRLAMYVRGLVIDRYLKQKIARLIIEEVQKPYGGTMNHKFDKHIKIVDVNNFLFVTLCRIMRAKCFFGCGLNLFGYLYVNLSFLYNTYVCIMVDYVWIALSLN